VRGAERQLASFDRLSLRAGVVVAERDRETVELLCRYGARPLTCWW
jgi:hypothetical protein